MSNAVAQMNEDNFDIANYGQPKKDLEWLKNNLDNEEEVLEFLDDPNNRLED